MNTLLDLLDAVKDSNSGKKKEYFDILGDAAETFLEYSGDVTDMERQVILTGTTNGTGDNLHKEQYKKLAERNAACAEFCGKLNDMANDIGFDLHVDTEDPMAVAKFVGDSLHAAYMRGIEQH
jgi:hypothetical protein